MRARLRAEVAALVDYDARKIGRRLARTEKGECRRAFQKRRRNVLVFLRLARARRIDEPTARRHDSRGMLEHLELRCGERSEVGLTASPADVGIPAQHA